MTPSTGGPKLGILLSGRGSNFQAIARSIAEGRLEARIAIVISDRKNAAGLEHARQLNLETAYLPAAGRSREEYDRELVTTLQAHGVEWVCLAGFMRLLSAVMVHAFPLRILNIHPSLLPAFPGLDAQRQALEHGAKVSGCTVHFVDEGLDSGPIIRQAAVPVLDNDTEDSLARRILAEEHRIYTEALRAVLSGQLRQEGRRIIG
jgi:phosphoribosylglycinamide formyltransferase-1